MSEYCKALYPCINEKNCDNLCEDYIGPGYKPTTVKPTQITNATTMKGISELVPAYSDLMQRVINKLSAARNYTELLESPETEAQAQKYRANVLKGIDEAVQLIRCGK